MLSTKYSQSISPHEFLQGERNSEIKHEFKDGEVFAMAGASVNHNKITGNVFRHLGNKLEGQRCTPFASDLLVKTSANSYRYPDVLVVCDENFIDDDYATETPVIIVEVISKSTHKKDEEEKRLEYINMPSLQEYVLIEQDFADVEVFRRSNGWQPSHYFLGDEVLFESVQVSLTVEKIYDRVRNEEVEKYFLDKMAEANEEPLK